MSTVLLIIHLFVTLALIGVVLIQRSEGGGLGIGSAQGMGSFMSGRGTANLLTRTTGILGALFFGLSLALALLNRGTVGSGRSILDDLPARPPVTAPASTESTPAIPGETPAPSAPALPAAPAASVPPAEPLPSGSPLTAPLSSAPPAVIPPVSAPAPAPSAPPAPPAAGGPKVPTN